jgi:hypothetical protein
MEVFDLGIAFVWEFDDDFIALLESELQDYSISTYKIQYFNLHETMDKIYNRKLGFSFYLDRAWDVDEEFEQMGKSISRRRTTILNPYKNVLHAIDKASMHLEFITYGLNVPHSIIIPPHSELEDIYVSLEDLSLLGRPFIIKPCNTTGGGIGVVTGAETLKEVLEQRVTNRQDKYLIQQKIYPSMLGNKRAWFRCFWAFGRAIPVWWDDQTHLYTEITDLEFKSLNLKKLKYITKTIAEISGLDFFSTEIVLTTENKFVVIDYVNDQCDMRLKSKHLDGVPDNIALQIIRNLRRKILNFKKSI